MTNSDWRTFSSHWEVDTPPLRLIDTGNRSPLPRKSLSFDMRLVGEPALDELSALAARDPRRLIDLLDRQRAVVAVRTCDLVRPAIDHHVQYVLPHNKGFLVHARVLSFRPLRTLNRKNTGGRGQRIALQFARPRDHPSDAASTRAPPRPRIRNRGGSGSGCRTPACSPVPP